MQGGRGEGDEEEEEEEEEERILRLVSHENTDVVTSTPGPFAAGIFLMPRL